jgi:glycine/D-amino acid oxidase-like deaminating enzyme
MRQTDPLCSLWQATARPAPVALGAMDAVEPLAALDGVEVVVVGAGVTGLSTALHLAERGARVVVLERDATGGGSTGRSNGQVIAGFQQAPAALLRAYGEDRGERLVQFGGAAPDLLFGLVARHAIECDAERAGWVQATRWRRGVDDLEKVVAAWRQRGAPVRMLDRGETAALLGTDAYAGGWVDERNGTIQPLDYARGLATAAIRAGAVLRSGVTVRHLQRDAGMWRVSTDRGELRAPTVVLATNVYTRQLCGAAGTQLGRTYLSAYSVQLASEPLYAAQLRSVLPQRHACGDTEHLRLRYFRLDREHRFVVGGPGWLRPPRTAAAASFRILERSARRMFPALRGVRFEYHWAARDTLTPDLIPHLYEPAPGLFAALGYNGRGLALGTAMGSVLARRVLGEARDALPLPTTPLTGTPFNLAAALRFYLGTAWRYFHH